MAVTDDNMGEIISKLASRGYRLEKIGNVDDKKYAALDEKHFRRVDKYDGTESKWAEWLFNFTVAISRASNSCWVAIEHVIKNGPLEVKAGAMDGAVAPEVRAKLGGKLFGLLCDMTTGEANTVVRSIVDKGMGYWVWSDGGLEVEV